MTQPAPINMVHEEPAPRPPRGVTRPLGEPAWTIVAECYRCIDGVLPEHDSWLDATGRARRDCQECCESGRFEVRGKRIGGTWRAVARPVVDPFWPASRDVRYWQIAECRTEEAARGCFGPPSEHDVDVIYTDSVRPGTWEHAVVLRELGIEVGR